MEKAHFETLSQVVNALSKQGYSNGFRTKENKFVSTVDAKEYQASELRIVESYRFDGATNPQDETMLFAIEAKDGNKGTMVISYGAQSGQNEELIKQIPFDSEQ